MRFRILILLLSAVFALSVSPAVFGQAIGSFSGTVLDKSGSSISGATVTAISQGTGVSRQTKTDDAGHYLIPLLPVSIYTVRVEFQGFQTAESKDLRLQIDEARELDFTLVPSSQSTQVEVSASAVSVETTNPSLGQVITAQQVAQLPLNGRNFVQLATLTTGTTQETNNNSFFNGAPSSEVSARGSFSLSVGGSRPNSTDWLLDGNDNNELTAGGISILSSIDDIQEFKVLTYNYSAEYGTRAGPTVLVTTKGGSNDFHGSLFEFFRNTSLDAKSFFATSPEKFNLNQFGGSIGGPIRKNKAFFFVDGEQKYQRHGQTFTGLVPTDAMRNGDFSHDAFGQTKPVGSVFNPNVTGSPSGTDFQCDALGNPMPLNGATVANPAGNGSQAAGTPCNKIPAGLINNIGKQLIALYPEPNANNPGNNFNFVSEPVRTLDETKFDVRLDQTFSSSDTAFARFSYDQASSYIPGGGGIGNFTEAGFFASNQGIINHGRNIALGETHIFSSSTINQISGGYNRIFNYITSQGSGTCTAARLGIPGANLDCSSGNTCAPSGVSCGLTISELLGNYFSVGDRGFSPFQGGTNVYSIGDSLDMIRGKHDIKVGMSIRAMQMNVKTEGFQDGFWEMTGGWTGDAEADLLMGLTSLAIHDQTFKGPTTGRRWKIFRPYVQDDWRLTNNITLNLGLAWDFTTPISEVGNRQANFNPSTGTFLIAGQGANKYAGIQWDKTALEPRIGVAWKPRGSEKTAVRAGYAIYHDSSWSQGAQGLWQNPPYYAESDLFSFGGGCTFPTAACATNFGQEPNALTISDGFQVFSTPPTASTFTGTIQAQNLDFKLGMVQQFNVNVEHQLPGDIVLTVGYAGSRGSHILVDGNNINVGSPGACAGGPNAVAGYTRGCGPGGAFFLAPYQSFCPFGFCSTILETTDQGRAHYNGLQIKAETKSARHGLYALIGYTYSRTYDTGMSDGLGSNYGATYFPLPNWPTLDWALSGLNLNNNFTASVIYDLPFGKGKQWGSQWDGPVNTILGNWQVTVIEKITSGFPVFIVTTDNNSGVGFFNNNANSLARPDLVSGCNPNAGPRTLQKWFNTACFAQPADGQLGNASRAPVTGPDFVNTDFSLIKQFALPREGMGLNFRVEVFNLFNHAQFATPNSTGSLGIPDFAAPGFGSIGATVNNPRLFQFGLKLTF
ncbi:MAG TPA: carboxypeptidase-like regulatory domain-containing protein [Candidatus Acidoferrum sp.]|nr:carboxypeptidase-like regulatory domain-containing protein [Candidatus Acidoferrum sp.]